MNKSSIRIVSNGTSLGTKVYTANGHEIKGISKIVIQEIKHGSGVRASLEFASVDLDMEAVTDVQPVLSSSPKAMTVSSIDVKLNVDGLDDVEIRTAKILSQWERIHLIAQESAAPTA
ncbi:hypothetical protein ACIPF8_19030 [Collimonas sp. NPDC087041]|uniref:hypothetical protein n=1 Tax=Collimonas sp. NPDC087041 TaxID=3363960 RepID=UPI00381B1033